MKIIQLYRNGKPLIGSIGRMHIDGRYNLASTINVIRERNARKQKNFKHEIATHFKYLGSNFNEIGNLIKI